MAPQNTQQTPSGAASADRGPVVPFEAAGEPVPRGRIDELVFAQLRGLGIRPARACSDEVFLRRAYLDVIGTLPTAEEARQFLADKGPKKRAALVDQLLGRDEYADYWAMKWSDLLRVKSEFPINLWPEAVAAYHRWIHDSLRANLPYDRFARALLTASGSNFRAPAVNFYRAIQGRDPQTIAKAVALTLMGARADRWPKARLAGMAAFFAKVGYKYTGEWKEEIVYFDPAKPPAKGSSPLPPPMFPDSTKPRPAPGQDPRDVFAAWLTAPGNAWFGRAIVNRLWCWLLGRGIVHEVDDIRPDNPPRNPQLLAYLERELVAGHYDLKHVLRLILNSATYQLSSIPRSTRPEAEACFARYGLRRLDAEVLIDALNQITGTTEAYQSPIPEPFTFIPESQRSVALADGSITSSFLEMFGRPPRDSGLEAERNNRPTADQRLHMINSSHIQRKLARCPMLLRLIGQRQTPRAAVDEIYLTVLSRYPTDAERAVLADHVRTTGLNGREAAVDLAWALINSAEFLYRH